MAFKNCVISCYDEESKQTVNTLGMFTIERLLEQVHHIGEGYYKLGKPNFTKVREWFNTNKEGDVVIIIHPEGYSEYLIDPSIKVAEDNLQDVMDNLLPKCLEKLAKKKKSVFGKNYFSKKTNLKDPSSGSGSTL